ncbi:MAG: DNA topoisomerase IB [Candidatus Eremiobacteraeota bacterium]|nr:DNA topoisomerase IB [Candidatus Eremiobacteraeota bacterium]
MKSPDIHILSDPIASAKAAGLRYVSDDRPGIRRKLQGKHFAFRGIDGRLIKDEAEINRIRALAVPPAYTDVWICPDPNGHIQATGRDARGRKQYRYHKRWREIRDETKYGRMIAFAQALTKIRARVDTDMARPGLPREKVLATVVQLLETTLIRVGNEEYATDNQSYGLTTLKDQHVDIKGSSLRFTFKGKSGVRHAIDLHDRRLSTIVRACRDIPGQHLFQYIDDQGHSQSIDSADVNEYIRHISGDEFSAKDFRTWVGTVTCALMLAAQDPIESAAAAKKNLNEVIKSVAQRLGNTPAVCRKCYIHPTVIESYMEGGALRQLPAAVVEDLKTPSIGLRTEERAVLDLLKKRLGESDSDRTTKLLRKSLRRRRANAH